MQYRPNEHLLKYALMQSLKRYSDGVIQSKPIEDDFEYFSFPQVFGSTTGPFGGVGGQGQTVFQMEVYLNQNTDNFMVIFVGGRLWKCVEATWEYQNQLHKMEFD